MSDQQLVTAGDLAQSEKLHAAFEAAKQAREAAQPRIDQGHADYELAALHRHAAGSLCRDVPGARLAALDAQAEVARIARDRILTEVEEPLRKAERALRDYDGRFINAASGWLGSVVREYGEHDQGLKNICQQARGDLDKMRQRMAPLREVVDLFGPVYAEVYGWKLPVVENPPYGSRPPSRFSPPRLSDWLER